MPEPLDVALAALRRQLLDPNALVRAVASGRRRVGAPPWRRVELRPVDLRGGRQLQVVSYDERQAHTRNVAYDTGEAVAVVDALLGEAFGNWHVRTTAETVQLRVTKKGLAQVHTAAVGPTPEPDRGHDRRKPRLLDPTEPFLHAVGIADASGRVKPSRQDKYRQVEEFLRVLDAALAAAPHVQDRLPLRVVDLGCGNAYLTLATYAWLTGRRQLGVELTGVDVRAAARERNAALAESLGWSGGLRFVEGTILDAPVEAADVALALHACDTATDEALARAVRWQAPLVLAAPCCHHDLHRQLAAAGPPPGAYALLTRHGILRERYADVLTDALRAALLRLLGYRVDVVEFVPSQHTPRNVLLRAVRTGAPPPAGQVEEYVTLVREWRVRPHLARLLEPELAAVLGPARPSL